MKEIKKIGILSLAKIYGITLAIVGFVAGFFIAIIGGMVGGMYGGAGMGAAFGFGSIILFPIIYGAMGFIFGALGAVIYNLVAKWVGGIEIELVDKQYGDQSTLD